MPGYLFFSKKVGRKDGKWNEKRKMIQGSEGAWNRPWSTISVSADYSIIFLLSQILSESNDWSKPKTPPL